MQPSTDQPQAAHDNESTPRTLRTWRTPQLMVLVIEQTEAGFSTGAPESGACKPSAS